MVAEITYHNESSADIDLKVTENGIDNYFLTVGRETYISGMSIDSGSYRSHITIGRYTSISKRVIVEIGINHNHHLVSNFPFRDFDSNVDPSHVDVNHYYENNHYSIIIGNDVWIGEGVRLLGGVRIGNGAVIGMGAVVTKDIPPYAVAVGNPIQVVKYRFDEDTIAKLQEIRWWNWDSQIVKNRYPEMENPKNFVEKYYQVSEEISGTEFTDLMDHLIKAGGNIFYFVFDCNAPQPLWDKVLSSFREDYQSNQNQLLIVDVPEYVRSDPGYPEAESTLDSFVSDCEGIIKICDDKTGFYHSNIYVAGNDVRSLSYIDMAFAKGMKIRSACDWQSGLFE